MIHVYICYQGQGELCCASFVCMCGFVCELWISGICNKHMHACVWVCMILYSVSVGASCIVGLMALWCMTSLPSYNWRMIITPLSLLALVDHLEWWSCRTAADLLTLASCLLWSEQAGAACLGYIYIGTMKCDSHFTCRDCVKIWKLAIYFHYHDSEVQPRKPHGTSCVCTMSFKIGIQFTHT